MIEIYDQEHRCSFQQNQRRVQLKKLTQSFPHDIDKAIVLNCKYKNISLNKKIVLISLIF